MVSVMASCAHLDQIQHLDAPAVVAGCEECLRRGSRWVHLRMCQSCGRVGCCDSSPERHASRHAADAAHPVLRSVEPGEDWSWCVVDEVMFRVAR